MSSPASPDTASEPWWPSSSSLSGPPALAWRPLSSTFHSTPVTAGQPRWLTFSPPPEVRRPSPGPHCSPERTWPQTASGERSALSPAAGAARQAAASRAVRLVMRASDGMPPRGSARRLARLSRHVPAKTARRQPACCRASVRSSAAEACAASVASVGRHEPLPAPGSRTSRTPTTSVPWYSGTAAIVSGSTPVSIAMSAAKCGSCATSPTCTARPVRTTSPAMPSVRGKRAPTTSSAPSPAAATKTSSSHSSSSRATEAERPSTTARATSLIECISSARMTSGRTAMAQSRTRQSPYGVFGYYAARAHVLWRARVVVAQALLFLFPASGDTSMLRFGRSPVVAGLAAALTLAGGATATAAAPSRTSAAARGLAPLHVQGATAAGRPAASRISLTLALAPRDAAGLAALAATPHAPISTRQFNARYAPTAAQVRTVRAWAARAGLTVSSVSANHLLVGLAGSPAKVGRAFGVRLVTYRLADGATYYTPDATARLPRPIASLTRSLLGLSSLGRASRPQMRRASGKAAAISFPQEYGPQDFWSLYNAPSGVTGAGQSLAVIAEGNLTQVKKDLATFESRFGLPAVTWNQINVGPPSSDTSGNGEYDLDTQYSTGFAPGVTTLNVYDGTSLL